MAKGDKKESHNPTSPDSRILVDSLGASQLLSVSKRHFLSLEKSGGIGILPTKIGNSTRILWHVESLKRWAAEGCKPRSQYLKEKDHL